MNKTFTFYPEGTCSQVIEIELEGNTIKDNKLFSAIMPDLWFLDGGIAMTHLWPEAEHQGKIIEFSYDPSDIELSQKEAYGCTMKIR